MKTKLHYTFFLLSAFTLLSFTVLIMPFYVESTDGDLSDQFDAPTGPFELVAGDNQLTSDQQEDDVDYITITIPEGLGLDELVLEGYTAEGTANQAFLGMQAGSAFTTDAMSTTASDLLGGITYGSQDLDTNLLVDMMDIGEGYDLPLPAGDYTFWLNQTGDNSEATLNFKLSKNLGFEDQTLDELVTIYPNPVQDQLNVRASSSIQIKEVVVMDLTGKIIRSFKNTTTADFSDLSEGIYITRIETTIGNVIRKVVVRRKRR